MTKHTQTLQNEVLRDHIMTLAEPVGWQDSLDLSRAGVDSFTGNTNVADFTQVVLVGHGTSLATCQNVESWIGRLANLPARAVPAFQMASYPELYLHSPETTLVVGISCSGATLSVVQALRQSRAQGATTLLISGRQDCEGGRVAEHRIDTHADLEKAVEVAAYSISHSFMMAAGFQLALGLGHARGHLDENQVMQWREALDATINKMAELPRIFEEVRHVVDKLGHASDITVCVLGTGPNHGTATEGALKISEFSWTFGASEELEDFAHGRFREVGPDNPLLIIAPSGPAIAKTRDLLAGCAIAGTPAVVFTDVEDNAFSELAHSTIVLPSLPNEYLTPFMYIFPLWFYGWHVMNNNGGLVGDKRHGLFAVDINFERHFNPDGSRKKSPAHPQGGEE